MVQNQDKKTNAIRRYFQSWDWGKFITWLIICAIIRFIIIGATSGDDQSRHYAPVNLPGWYEMTSDNTN